MPGMNVLADLLRKLLNFQVFLQVYYKSADGYE